MNSINVGARENSYVLRKFETRPVKNVKFNFVRKK
jgi:hypothetical protein